MSIIKNAQANIRNCYILIVTLLHLEKNINEDTKRKQFILNFLSISMTTFLSLLLILSLYSLLENKTNYIGVPATILFLFIIASLISVFFSKKGKTTIGGIIILSLIYICILYGSIHWGADLPTVLIALFLTVLMSGILINSRMGFVCAIILSVHLGIFNYIENDFFLKTDYSWKKELFNKFDVIEYPSLLIFASLFSWLSNDRLEKSLKKSREAEIKLQLERDNLEEIVIERIKIIKRMQIEKINSMYRMVEFGRISSGLFHDIINPLTDITLNLQMLKIEEAKYSIKHLIPSIHRIENLIRQSKKHIRIDSTYTLFNIREEILSVVCILKYKSNKNMINVELEDANEPIDLYGSQTLFSHIIMNLVSNAIDSHIQTPDDNKLKEKRFVKITTKINTNELVIKIIDNGNGIDKDIMENIFEPFYTTKKELGCGIGLSATRHVLEKYFNGKIEVESQIKKGSIFMLSIPLAGDRKPQNHQFDSVELLK